MTKPKSPFLDRSVPKVAHRLGMPPHQLRRGINHGDVKTQSWAGREWIPQSEEDRIAALLAEERGPDPHEPIKPTKATKPTRKAAPARELEA